MSATRNAIGLMVLIGAIYAFAGYLMIGEIRRNYQDLYNEFGSPTLFPIQNPSIKEQWRFFVFTLPRKYAAVGSSKIHLLGDIMLLCSIIHLFLCNYLFMFHSHDLHN